MRRKMPMLLAGALVLCVTAGLAFWYWRSTRRIDTRRVYTIGYNHNPPFQLRTPDGQATGFAVEAVQAAADRSGIQLRWIFDETANAQKFRDGQVDLWPLYADLPERHSFAHISDPWMISDNYLMVRGTSGELPPRGFTGAILFSGPALYREMITKRWPKADMRLVKDPPMLYPPFCEGSAPVVFVSSHQANVLLREVQRLCPGVRFRSHHLPDLTSRMGVASGHAWTPVADQLRDEILAMGESGELGEILARYAYVGVTEMRTILHLVALERQSRMLTGLLAALGVALVVMGWLIWRVRRARHAAEQASISKSEFLANMSHEIRTPLGGVIGMLELALEGGAPLPAAQKDYLETAHVSAKTLLTILNDILDFSKIEARRLDLSPVVVDVHALLGDVAGLMSPVARRKGLQFSTNIDDRAPRHVRVDPVRLKQVLLNLCGNAIKFTAQGSVELSMRAGDRPETLAFAVQDSGIGIPAAKLESIFVAFEQVDGSITRHFGGTGLGLAISKQLVELMGGSGISVESTEGQGSKFLFQVRAETAAQPAAAPVEAAAATVVPLRLLLAEDNPVNQKLIGTLLRRDGHEVTLAGSGVEAVAAARKDPFDAILMDIQMPEMDGFQATASIRALGGALGTVPVIALTAHAQSGYEEICRRAGMNGYVTKPVDRGALRRTLGEVASSVKTVKSAR